MEKIKSIPLFLFGIFATKALILGADWVTAGIILILAATSTMWEMRVQDKRQKELEEVLRKQNETILALAKVVEEVKTNVSAVKVAQGMRSVNVGR
jgi:uncharacterized protein YlxW (UPF0749 family)